MTELVTNAVRRYAGRRPSRHASDCGHRWPARTPHTVFIRVCDRGVGHRPEPTPSARSNGSGGPAGTGTPAAVSDWVCISSDGSWSDKTDGYHCVRAMAAAPSPRYGCHGPTARCAGRRRGGVTRVDGGDAGASDRAWTWSCRTTPSGARLARQRLAAELRGLDPARRCSPTRSRSSPSCSATRSGTPHPLPGGVIRLAWRVGRTAGDDVVVSSGSPTAARPRRRAPRSAGPDSVDGRGLAIVAALAAALGRGARRTTGSASGPSSVPAGSRLAAGPCRAARA